MTRPDLRSLRQVVVRLGACLACHRVHRARLGVPVDRRRAIPARWRTESRQSAGHERRARRAPAPRRWRIRCARSVRLSPASPWRAETALPSCRHSERRPAASEPPAFSCAVPPFERLPATPRSTRSCRTREREPMTEIAVRRAAGIAVGVKALRSAPPELPPAGNPSAEEPCRIREKGESRSGLAALPESQGGMVQRGGRATKATRKTRGTLGGTRPDPARRREGEDLFRGSEQCVEVTRAVRRVDCRTKWARRKCVLPERRRCARRSYLKPAIPPRQN